MKFSQTFKLTAISTLLATTAVLSHAHSPFIAPQTYVVDGETAAVLGGYAEAAFASEYAISGFDLTVTAPSGEVQKLEPQAIKHLTVADVLIKEEGTFKVVGQKESKNEYAQINGKWYRIMESHSEQVPPLAERTFATPAEVPAKAKKLATTSHTQLVSYFSKGKVSDQVLAATGKGLEIAYSVHPSNLKAGQPVTLTVNANGKPQKDFELFALKQVLVVGEEAVEIEQKTDAKGQITLTFPKAGQYLLEISSPATADGAAPAAESYRQHVAVLVN